MLGLKLIHVSKRGLWTPPLVSLYIPVGFHRSIGPVCEHASVCPVLWLLMVPTDLEKCLNLIPVLKSVWFFNPPWKSAIFLEKCLKMTFYGLEKLWPQKPITLYSVCVFFVRFVYLILIHCSRFDNFVIKYVPTDPVIHVFHGEYCTLLYGKLFYHRIKHLLYSR